MAAGLLLLLAGGGIVGMEWGLRGFQTVGSPARVGQLEIEAGPGGVSATWSDWYGRSTARWGSPCTRLSLEGEVIEWGKLARALGFQDRHRVTGGRLSSPPEAPGADCPGRIEFRPPEAAWTLLERGGRWMPLAKTRELESPPLRVATGIWKVFVVPGGYAFSE